MVVNICLEDLENEIEEDVEVDSIGRKTDEQKTGDEQ